MKSAKRIILFSGISFFSLAVSAQENFNPYGYATSLKQAVKQPTNIMDLLPVLIPVISFVLSLT